MLIEQIQLLDTRGTTRAIDVHYDPDDVLLETWVDIWKAHPAGREESSHREWHWMRLTSSSLFDRRFLALVEGNDCQGLMKLVWPKAGRQPAGVQLMYVDYLEVAPSNRPGPDRDLKGAGAALIQLAIHESHEQGFGGRIGLHSLPTAEAFYRRLALTEYPKDANYENLVYFEQ